MGLFDKVNDAASQAKDAAAKFADDKGISEKVSGAASVIKKAYEDTAASVKAHNI